MKIRVGVLYGGKATEHEVSIITAVQAMSFLNKDKYEVVPIYLTKDNEMYTGDPLKEMDVYRDMDLLKRYCKNVVCYNRNGALALQAKNGLFRKKTIDIGWQVDGRWHVDGRGGVVGIAWMPLPEPYEESEG